MFEIGMSSRRSNKLAQTVGLKQILKKCSSPDKNEQKAVIPEDVPRGHFVVYVGEMRSRFVVPITWLTQPDFVTLLRESEEEYGFSHDKGITIPCNEVDFHSLTASCVAS